MADVEKFSLITFFFLGNELVRCFNDHARSLFTSCCYHRHSRVFHQPRVNVSPCAVCMGLSVCVYRSSTSPLRLLSPLSSFSTFPEILAPAIYFLLPTRSRTSPMIPRLFPRHRLPLLKILPSLLFFVTKLFYAFSTIYSTAH